jgi:D-alanyl-lipoteichoic acid acyltransferase DltB (MBOAT superfamily)
MLFNSLTFALFVPAVFALYWLIPRDAIRLRNLFLIAASYVFYGWWDWRFLSLIVLSSAVDFFVGRSMGRSGTRAARKRLLALSLGVNLGVLGFFKYFDFFIHSLAAALSSVGLETSLWSLSIILPVGISFYTFQTLSYTIDIYRRRIEPTHDILAFFAFVSFFPQLVAGPIERAASLLPQFLGRRGFDASKASDGARQALWGLFKKTVVADNLAPMVDAIFADPGSQSSPVLVLGAVYFGIQIYADFSGYSDIAIGTARLFGFDLRTNFAYPYFSRNVREFWGRWHISLSTWFRDYVYIPLGGSRTSDRFRQYINVLITFTVSGLWHGANWTFAAWGFLHGLFYAPVVFGKRSFAKGDTVIAAGRYVPPVRDTVRLLVTYTVVTLSWIFFRAETIADAGAYFTHMFSNGLAGGLTFQRGIVYVGVVLAVDWVQRTKPHALEVAALPVWLRWVLYYIVVVAIIAFGATGHVPFIYFQF